MCSKAEQHLTLYTGVVWISGSVRSDETICGSALIRSRSHRTIVCARVVSRFVTRAYASDGVEQLGFLRSEHYRSRCEVECRVYGDALEAVRVAVHGN